MIGEKSEERILDFSSYGPFDRYKLVCDTVHKQLARAKIAYPWWFRFLLWLHGLLREPNGALSGYLAYGLLPCLTILIYWAIGLYCILFVSWPFNVMVFCIAVSPILLLWLACRAAQTDRMIQNIVAKTQLNWQYALEWLTEKSREHP